MPVLATLPEATATAAAADDSSRSTASADSCDREPLTLRKLFDAHYPSVWRLLRRLGVDVNQVDDAAQEVFWVAARRLKDIESGRESAFLYGVALRVALSEQRRARSRPQLTAADATDQLIDEAPTPERQLEDLEARALLDRLLAQMPDDLRTVFVLYELEHLEVRAIAELLNLPFGTASSRLRRAREHFSASVSRVRKTLQRREVSAL